MKNVLIITILFIFNNLYGIAIDEPAFQFGFKVTSDTYIRADIASSANWYKTTMPGFTLSCIADFPNKDSMLHEMALLLYYFESNQFSFNTVALDPGAMRLILIKSPIKYLCHLPLNPIWSFIVGGSIIPQYEQISSIVTYTNSMSQEDFSINICPTFGFSIASPQSYNFQTEFSPGIALPVMNTLTLPNNSYENYEAIHGSLQIDSIFNLYISKIRLGLCYNYTLSTDIYFKLEESNSQLLNAKIQHANSIGISLGYAL